MARPTIVDVEQGTPEWLALRIGAITGTRGSRILNGDGDEVMREMVREALGLPSEIVVTEPMLRGQVKEPIARFDYARTTGYNVRQVGIVIHAEIEWLRYSPDGLIPGTDWYDGVLEIKCPFSGKPYPEPIPQYELQTKLGVHICDVGWGDLWVWGDEEQSIQTFHSDDAWFTEALEKLTEFHARYEEIMDDPAKQQPYAQPRVLLRNDRDWKEAAEKYLEATAAHSATERRLKAARDEIVALTDGHNCEGFGVRATAVGPERKTWRISCPK